MVIVDEMCVLIRDKRIKVQIKGWRERELGLELGRGVDTRDMGQEGVAQFTGQEQKGCEKLVVFHSCAKDGGKDRFGMMIHEEYSWVPGAVSAVQRGERASKVKLI